jgi:hypothetical protein
MQYPQLRRISASCRHTLHTTTLVRMGISFCKLDNTRDEAEGEDPTSRPKQHFETPKAVMFDHITNGVGWRMGPAEPWLL